jgi:hypothetical protein
VQGTSWAAVQQVEHKADNNGAADSSRTALVINTSSCSPSSTPHQHLINGNNIDQN